MPTGDLFCFFLLFFMLLPREKSGLLVEKQAAADAAAVAQDARSSCATLNRLKKGKPSDHLSTYKPCKGIPHSLGALLTFSNCMVRRGFYSLLFAVSSVVFVSGSQ